MVLNCSSQRCKVTCNASHHPCSFPLEFSLCHHIVWFSPCTLWFAVWQAWQQMAQMSAEASFCFWLFRGNSRCFSLKKKPKTLNKYYQESPREREWPPKSPILWCSHRKGMLADTGSVREDKFVTQNCRNPPTIAVSLRAHSCIPPFTTVLWQEEKLFRTQSDKENPVFQHKALWHLIFRDWYYRKDPETPVCSAGSSGASAKELPHFSALHLIALDFFNMQHPSFKRRVSSGSPAPTTYWPAVKGHLWDGENWGCVQAVEHIKHQLPTPWDFQLSARRRLRTKGVFSAPFCRQADSPVWCREHWVGRIPPGR